MYKAIPGILILSLVGCEPPGPTEAEIAAKALEKSCARLYEGQTKVFRDELYKRQVPEDKVKFGEKAEYVKKCIDAGLDKDQMKCIDPNLQDESCKEKLKDVADKVEGLKKFLFSPMSGETPAGDAAAGDAAAGDAAAGDAAKPAGDAAAGDAAAGDAAKAPGGE